MRITGIAFPLGKLSKQEEPWGVAPTQNEINRLMKQMPGKPLKMCTEAFTNKADAHACDLTDNATIGKIRKVTHDTVNNVIRYDADISNDSVSHGISNGTIKKNTSPRIGSDYKDTSGLLHDVEFDCLTIVRNPAFEDSVFTVSYVGEGEDDTQPSEPPQTPAKKPNPLNLGQNNPEEPKSPPPPATITLSMEDLDKLIAERVKAMTSQTSTPPAPQTPPTPPKEENDNPGEQPFSKDQFDQLYESRRESERKEEALNEYRIITHALGIEIDEAGLVSLNALDSKTIKKMNADLRGIKEKIPKEEKKEKKPIYYNPENGTGGFDGIGEFTVGYPDDDGVWQTK